MGDHRLCSRSVVAAASSTITAAPGTTNSGAPYLDSMQDEIDDQGSLSELGAYWGKASTPSDKSNEVAANGARSHPLIAHCMDVAAVARTLLGYKRRLTTYWAERCGISPDAFERLVVFASVIHDLGKLSVRFQSMRPDLMPAHLERRPGRGRRHDALGTAIWHCVVRERLLDRVTLFHERVPRRSQLQLLDLVVQAAACHHGKPDSCGVHEWVLETYPEDPISRVSMELFEVAAEISGVAARPIAMDSFARDAWRSASWWISGFVVLADWLGSSQEYFPYHSGPIDVRGYWRDVALRRATGAVEGAGIATRRYGTPSARPSLRSLFPEIDRPRPLQSLADEHPLGGLRQCLVIEDVTGSGKTEAALTFAARMLHEGIADGVYFALPTMATANAMYDRLDGCYRRIVNGDSGSFLALAHGSSRMHEGYVASMTDVGSLDSSASCSIWLGQGNKRALLAPFSVGTIDQALLAVLPSRHQNLRLLGLADKILIVDEVHACDEYVLELLRKLLRRHAEAGGSAILLSATLPRRTRQQLTDAWFSGLPESDGCVAPQLESGDFPLLSQVTSAGYCEIPTEAEAARCRSIPVSLSDDEEAIFAALIECAGRGGCGVWIRNTVADAIRAWETLRTRLHDVPEPMLFHARFALCDRLERERQVLTAFGASSAEGDRRGRILVATQVVEQSLDLDFDLLATDLAPIDLVIQRAGRWRRHSRDSQGNRSQHEGRPPGGILMHSPSPDDAEVFARFLDKEGRGLGTVYPHHPRLWRTARALVDRGAIRIPQDSRDLVETVYDEEIGVAAPERLSRAETRAAGDDAASRCLAANNALEFAAGYTPKSSRVWGNDDYTPTRLGEPTLRARLAVWRGGQLVPWDVPGPHAWERSEVAVRSALLGDAITSDQALSAAMDLHRAENHGLPGRVLLPLEIDDAGYAGASRVCAANGDVRTFRYDRDRGLTWE